ncbi:MAG: hypothetical protein IPG69_10640 [Flavobacteriales bacterium]|jgi:hypothetical protein|nr:hypothetical protein [Flavobacteriales bacterium]MBK9076570.1 hypothetical protein [Flavobacteriales bacterium]MBK9539624.1 hypothetical protein [Flavobacteriales bacterium]
MFVLLPSTLLYGQIDLGVELGGSAYRLKSGSHAYREGVFEPFPGPSFSAAAFYRELPEKAVGIGLEVCYTRLNFNASFRDGGIGSGTEYVSVVELDMLHVGIIPRFKIDESGWFALRTGLMAGWIAGREQGTSVSLSLPISHGSYDRAAGNRFKGDLRVVGALDVRIPWGTGCALHIDPYASLGLTSLLQTDRMKAADVGIRIGIAWASRGRTFGKVMRDDLARREGIEK